MSLLLRRNFLELPVLESAAFLLDRVFPARLLPPVLVAPPLERHWVGHRLSGARLNL